MPLVVNAIKEFYAVSVLTAFFYDLKEIKKF